MNKKRILITVTAVILVAALAFSVVSIKTNQVEPRAVKAYNSDAEKSIIDSGTVFENDNLKMDWDSDYCRVSITDKRTGKTIGTTPTEALENQVGEDGMPKAVHPMLNSPITVEYLDPESYEIKQLTAYIDSISEENVSAKKTDNGISITYYFDDYSIAIPVEFVLREDDLVVTVDADGIEEGDYKVVSVAIAPFMDGIKNTEQNGYLFVPSGSGAIIYPSERGDVSETLSMEVYGNDADRNLESEHKLSNEESVHMPVFGSKNGDNAVCGIIEENAECASIEVILGAKNIGYSAVYPKFAVRGYQWVKPKRNKVTYVQLYSDNLISGKLSVSYKLLSGDEAGYTGMANTYRDYLIKKYDMSSLNKEAAISLTVLGGTNIKNSFLGVPYNDFYAATTLKQAEQIINSVSEKAENNLAVNFSGFGESGLYPGSVAGGYKVNGKLGSLKQMSELQNRLKQAGISSYMNFDLVYFTNGASKAQSANGQTTFKYPYLVWSGKRDRAFSLYYLIQRSKLNEYSEKLVKKSEKVGLSGIALESLSSVSWSDYRNPEYNIKSGMAKDAGKVFADIEKSGISAASVNANDYAAANSSYIFGTPVVSSEYRLFSEDIPFYQMVFKGYKQMSVPAVNLAEDKDIRILKAVESGCALGFEVAYSYDTKLLESSYPNFYATKYENVEPMIESAADRLKDYYKSVSGAAIKNHRILENGLRQTVFSSGVSVTVNFSDKAVDFGDISIPAKDFIVTKGG